MSVEFDFNFVPGLPVPVGKWSGFPKYNFVGGHNDAEHVPVDALIAAATSVLKREGFSLATYGLNSGPLGYRPLRDFLVGKLKSHAGIACEADEILITSGSLQGLDLVNSLLLSPGRHRPGRAGLLWRLAQQAQPPRCQGGRDSPRLRRAAD